MGYKMTMQAARINAGLTQVEIAKKMGVSDVCYRSWENNRHDIGSRKLELFCSIVSVPMGAIFLPKMSS